MASAARPTPASPDTGETWQPLRFLTFYRLVLAGLLAVLFFALRGSNPFNVELPGLFSNTLLTYLGFSIIIGFTTRLHWPGYQSQALLQIFVDIGAISLLMHATGGVTSPFTVLLAIAVATGALALPGRMAYLFAAVATLAVLFETGLASLSLAPTGAADITRAGLMGVVLFTTAGLSHILVIRIRESEALAQQRGSDLANLQQLNEYVIQQLQSGVLVVDPDYRIRLANDNARELLGLENQQNMQLETVAPELARQLHLWQRDSDWQPEPVPARASGSTLMPRIGRLETARGSGALILLDDAARLTHQTQQIKLASLGRLTASIAHEIRNPLGAISHASQLLSESERLDSGDRRLTEIICSHTQRVNIIIENVLQLSRRSASRPQLLPLREWLKQFHDELVQSEHIAPERLDIQIEPEDLNVRIDPGHLHQLLTNLCQNALRHGSGNAPVLLQAHKSKTGVAQLDVIDDGPGIDAETADQMFEPFYTTAASGTGLGLYIARELCEVNEAHLSYHPVDSGSCFRIQFAAHANG